MRSLFPIMDRYKPIVHKSVKYKCMKVHEKFPAFDHKLSFIEF